MDSSSKKIKAVYTIVGGDKDRSRWVQVGVGFVNRDDSITVRLDAHPVNGVLQIREMRPRNTEPRTE